MNLDVADSPTEFIGIFCFAVAAWACWRAGRAGGPTWRTLAVAQMLVLIEIFFRSRYHLHDIVDEIARADGWYSQRTPVQFGLIAIVVVLAGIGAFIVSRDRRHTVATVIALVATIAAMLLLAVETVSLHAVDSLLYAQVGPLRAIVFGWIVPAVVVTLSAIRTARA